MIKGTTPTFILTIDDDNVDLTEATNVYVTFKQGTLEITKTGPDIVIAAKQVDIYMSQEETLRFSKGMASIQMNWTYDGGKRACTNIVRVDIGENLKEEVLQ